MREADAPGGAHQQLDAQVGFQRIQPAAHDGRGHAFGLGSGRQTAAVATETNDSNALSLSMPALLHKVIGFEIFFVFISSNICNTVAYKLPTGILPPGSKPVFQPLFKAPSMTDRTTVHGLQVATSLFRFVEDKVPPGTGVDSSAFWKGFDAIVADLALRNIALLAERDRLQTELDTWHKANPGPIRDMVAYRSFLERSATWCPSLPR